MATSTTARMDDPVITAGRDGLLHDCDLRWLAVAAFLGAFVLHFLALR